MKPTRQLFPLAGLLFVIGFAGLSRFAGHVRALDAVGISGGGFALGVGFTLLMFGIVKRAPG
jgi:hypothetical protein